MDVALDHWAPQMLGAATQLVHFEENKRGWKEQAQQMHSVKALITYSGQFILNPSIDLPILPNGLYTVGGSMIDAKVKNQIARSHLEKTTLSVSFPLLPSTPSSGCLARRPRDGAWRLDAPGAPGRFGARGRLEDVVLGGTGGRR